MKKKSRLHTFESFTQISGSFLDKDNNLFLDPSGKDDILDIIQFYNIDISKNTPTIIYPKDVNENPDMIYSILAADLIDMNYLRETERDSRLDNDLLKLIGADATHTMDDVELSEIKSVVVDKLGILNNEVKEYGQFMIDKNGNFGFFPIGSLKESIQEEIPLVYKERASIKKELESYISKYSKYFVKNTQHSIGGNFHAASMGSVEVLFDHITPSSYYNPSKFLPIAVKVGSGFLSNLSDANPTDKLAITKFMRGLEDIINKYVNNSESIYFYDNDGRNFSTVGLSDGKAQSRNGGTYLYGASR
jgi:hypothetical protein